MKRSIPTPMSKVVQNPASMVHTFADEFYSDTRSDIGLFDKAPLSVTTLGLILQAHYPHHDLPSPVEQVLYKAARLDWTFVRDAAIYIGLALTQGGDDLDNSLAGSVLWLNSMLDDLGTVSIWKVHRGPILFILEASAMAIDYWAVFKTTPYIRCLTDVLHYEHLLRRQDPCLRNPYRVTEAIAAAVPSQLRQANSVSAAELKLNRIMTNLSTQLAQPWQNVYDWVDTIDTWTV